MYLMYLEADEKEAFFSLAIKLANSDASLHANEVQSLQMMAREMGISAPDLDDSGSGEIGKLCGKISSVRSKRIAAFELLALANADRDFSEVEENLLMSILEQWNIDESFLIDASDLAVSMNNCVKTGFKLIEG